MTTRTTDRQERPGAGQRRPRRTRWPLPAVLALVLALLPALAPAAADTPAGEELDDADIELAMESELLLAAGVPAHRIDVSAHLGVVTLDGVVDNILARERAERVASMVKGVRSVVNQVTVEAVERPDAALLRDVREALASDPATESWEISVAVRDGAVTLAGTVDSWQERKLAERVAKGVRGVESVANEIEMVYEGERSDIDIASDIRAALMWDVRIDDALVEVTVEDGRVTLGGTVGSSFERSLAAASAWVPGVEAVDAEGLTVEWWARDEMLARERFSDRSDEEIARAVRDALLFDPRVASFRPEVSVDDGVVTLTGVVDNLKAKNAAAQDAANTAGVWQVKNFLKVRPDVQRSDEEVAEEVRADLVLDPYVDRFEIDVEVDAGVARLEGRVDSWFEKWQAQEIATRVTGVEQVRNAIVVDYERRDYEGRFHDWDVVDTDYDVEPGAVDRASDWQIRRDTNDGMFWSPFVDADQVQVAVADGIVTLSGTVDSWAERQQATEEAIEAGAIAVDNDLEVAWGPDLPVF